MDWSNQRRRHQRRLFEAALSQQWVKDSAANIIITAIYERTTVKYGERGIMYVHMEAGHAAQNICLQATSLGLGAVTVGAFDNDQIKGILGLSPKETLHNPCGKKKAEFTAIAT
jgi:SagB-type dehydrogenase family enzyme